MDSRIWTGAVALLLVAAACDAGGPTGPGTGTPEPVAAVVVEPDSLTLTVGQSRRLTATTTASDGAALAGRRIEWLTENDSIVSIDASGAATAHKPGVVTITATSEGKSGKTRITVHDSTQPVARVKISPQGPLTLSIGATQQLSAHAFAADGAELPGRPAIWSSASESVARVDATGTLAARAGGSAVITATIAGESASVTVQVVNSTGVVASLSLNMDSLALEEGSSRELVSTARDAQGQVVTGRAVQWSSSDPGVAQVSPGGIVSPIRPGIATVTARVDGQTASAPVRVYATYAYDLLYDGFTGGMTELLRLDLRTPGGQPARIFPNQRWASDAAASPDGSRIAVVRNDATGARGIWLVSPDGTGITELTSGADDQPAWSTDGQWIAFRRRTPGGGTDVWVIRPDGSGARSLTADHGPTNQASPTWSPDGRIAYSHAADGRAHLWIMAIDGTGKRQLTTGEVFDDEPSWSPDGDRIAFQRFGDILVVNAGGGSERVLVRLPFGQFGPAWSPDGKLLAFSSKDEAGAYQVYTVRADGDFLAQRTFDPAGGQASPPHKEHPAWLVRR